jgi:renalase
VCVKKNREGPVGKPAEDVAGWVARRCPCSMQRQVQGLFGGAQRGADRRDGCRAGSGGGMSGSIGHVAVIGAGIAGLACATALARVGIGVTMFEKSRRPGGRVATRPVDGLSFNHGAQFATAHGPDFAALLAGLAAAGIAASWPAAGGEGRRMSFRPGMSALPAAMAEQAGSAGAELRTARHAAFLHRTDGGWQVRHLDAADIRPGGTARDGGDLSGPFGAVLIALPGHQAASLVATAGHRFADTARTAVMAPCWAVMARFAAPVDGCNVRQSATSPVARAAREGSRPGAEPAADHWVLHASADWSRTYLDDSPEVAGAALIATFRAETGAAAPNLVLAHCWRYALAETPLGQACLWDDAGRLGLCGDWCLGGRIEGAHASGTALARAVLAAA